MKRYTRLDILRPHLLHFTADLHLFHKNIIAYCNRPFSDVDEMAQALIDNRNAVVPCNGSVFVLGDMF